MLEENNIYILNDSIFIEDQLPFNIEIFNMNQNIKNISKNTFTVVLTSTII